MPFLRGFDNRLDFQTLNNPGGIGGYGQRGRGRLGRGLARGGVRGRGGRFDNRNNNRYSMQHHQNRTLATSILGNNRNNSCRSGNNTNENGTNNLRTPTICINGLEPCVEEACPEDHYHSDALLPPPAYQSTPSSPAFGRINPTSYETKKLSHDVNIAEEYFRKMSGRKTLIAVIFMSLAVITFGLFLVILVFFT